MLGSDDVCYVYSSGDTDGFLGRLGERCSLFFRIFIKQWRPGPAFRVFWLFWSKYIPWFDGGLVSIEASGTVGMHQSTQGAGRLRASCLGLSYDGGAGNGYNLHCRVQA